MFRRTVLAVLPVAALATYSATSSQAAAPMSTSDFVTAAAQSDQFEIQEGQLAADRGSPSVRSFGQDMVRDHTRTSEEMAAAVREAGMPTPPPSPLRPDQKGMIDKLQALSGADFDKTYLTQQVQAHKEALGLMMDYAESGDVPPIKAAARQTVPIVKMHLSMAEKMAK